MRDLYCMIGVLGWILGIFGTSVGLGFLGVALKCDGEPTVVRCNDTSEHLPDEVAFVTLTEFTPLLDGASYVTYNDGKTYSAHVPLVPASAELRGESVRAVAAISGVRSEEEVAAAFSAGQLTGLLLKPCSFGGSRELQETCPGLPIDFCRKLNVGDEPGSVALWAGVVIASMIGFGAGLVMLVHGLFGIPDPRPLNGAFMLVPLIFLVQGAGWLGKKLIPAEAAGPLAIGAGVFLFGTGAMQLHQQGLSALSPYEPGPTSALLVDAGFALLLLGGYFVCRKAPGEVDSPEEAATSAAQA